MTTFREIITRMGAEARAEIHGPETLYGMTALFEEYHRCVKLAEHNRGGHNPRYPGKAGQVVGAKLQAKADHLAECFPVFPETLKRVDKR